MNEDTFTDKAFRFVLGAVIGGGLAFVLFGTDFAADMAGLEKVVLGAAGACGALAVAFGNRFIEWVLGSRWSWW